MAVLITGGWRDNKGLQSAEIFNIDTNQSIFLPKLSQSKFYHTQEDNYACGGYETDISNSETDTCQKWDNDTETWTQSHMLTDSRYGHVSWSTSFGVYLMGGAISGNEKTSEVMKNDGTVEKGFDLRYDTV